MIEYLAADAPMWATLALVAGAGTAGRLFGRARRQELAQRAESAERAAGFAVGRARVHQPVAETLTRVIAGSNVPARDLGLAGTVVATAARDAETLLADFDPVPRAARPELTGMPEEQRDWDGPDDGDDGEPDRTGPPPEPEPEVAPVYAAAVAPLPRYDWSRVGWDPLAGTRHPSAPVGGLPGVPGRGWGWPQYMARVWSVVWAWTPAPVRWVRSLAGWSFRAAARKEARELAEAAQLLGFDIPDEPAVAAVVEPTQAQPPPVPVIRKPATHFIERGKVWARVLLPGWRPCGAEGRHHLGVAAGALAQRQSRMLALPGGTR